MIGHGMRRFLLVGGGLFLLVLGLIYAWTFTPSYTLYRIKRALETHDYATFARYVDLDSVLDHALDEVAAEVQDRSTPPSLPQSFAKALRKGLRQGFARELTKAGLTIAVEQAVTDPNRQLPQIPALAVVAALWSGDREGDLIHFSVPIKKGRQVAVEMRQTSAGTWRVVAVTHLSALFPALRSRTAPSVQEDS
ncbi:MAG: DUF2939 domain-containing protein [Candidatus Binatia bacterium]|nr:DUF2939 domain-containing protein [Candidatus Binatia bacterium]